MCHNHLVHALESSPYTLQFASCYYIVIHISSFIDANEAFYGRRLFCDTSQCWYHTAKLVVPLHQFMCGFLWFILRHCRYVGHVVSNGRMIYEWWTGKDLKGSSGDLIQILCRHLLGGTLKFLCQDSPCLDEDSNRPLPARKSRALPLRQRARFFRSSRMERIHSHSISFKLRIFSRYTILLF
jgi:hypothetical protein